MDQAWAQVPWAHCPVEAEWLRGWEEGMFGCEGGEDDRGRGGGAKEGIHLRVNEGHADQAGEGSFPGMSSRKGREGFIESGGGRVKPSAEVPENVSVFMDSNNPRTGCGDTGAPGAADRCCCFAATQTFPTQGFM